MRMLSSDGEMRHSKSVVVVGAMFATFIMLSCTASPAAALTDWEGFLTPLDTVTSMDQVLSSSAVDPSGNVELAFSAVLESIDRTVGGTLYHEITIGSTLGADTYGLTGYEFDAVFTYSFVGGSTYTIIDNLGDDEGIMVKFPVMAGGQGYFNFYGKWYDSVFISANGFISFGTPDLEPNERTSDLYYTKPPGTIGNDALPNGVIAPYWRDMKPNLGGDIWLGFEYDNPTDLVIMWRDMPTADGVVQTFGVILETTGAPETGAYLEGRITFIYPEVKLEYKPLSKRDKYTLYPAFEMGVENQWGGRAVTCTYTYAPLIGGKNEVSYNKRLRLDALPGNFYEIDKVGIDICKVSWDDAGNYYEDPDAMVDITGQLYDQWAGSNVILASSPEDPEDLFADYANQLTVETALMATGFIAGGPVGGLLLGATGMVLNAYQFCEEYEAATNVEADPADYVNPEDGSPESWGLVTNRARDAVTQIDGQASDVWISPVFKWRLNPANLAELYGVHHYMALLPWVEYKSIHSADTAILRSASLSFLFDQGRVQLFRDDFDDGLISPWTYTSKGTATTRLDSYYGEKQALSESFSDYNLNGWEIVETGGDVSLAAISGTSSGEPALMVAKTSADGSGEASATKRFWYQAGYFELKTYLRTNTGCKYSPVSLTLEQAGADRVCVGFYKGDISYLDNSGTWNPIFHDYVNYYTYIFTIKVWPMTGNYSVGVGGAFAPSVPMLGYAPWTNNYIDSVQIRAGGVNTGTGVSIWADDLNIYGDQCVYLSYGTGSEDMLRYSSPTIGINRLEPYGIALNYRPTPSSVSHIVVIDDGKMELVNKIDTADGISKLYANTPSGLVIVAVLNSNEWHNIVVNVNPSTNSYGVFVDGGGCGTYTLKSTSVPSTSITLWFGSRAYPYAVDGGSGYWDDISVAELAP